MVWRGIEQKLIFLLCQGVPHFKILGDTLDILNHMMVIAGIP